MIQAAFGWPGGGAEPQAPVSFVASVRLFGRSTVERRVGPAPVVEVHPPADAGPGLRASGELGQVHALVLERSPQALDKHVVHPAALAVHRDANASRLEHVGEVDAGELTPLVAIEDLGRTIALERLSQGRDAEARLERVGQAPGQHLAARPVHHRDQVQKAPLQWDVGDIRAPHVVRPRDRQVAQQVRIDPVSRVRLRRPGVLEDRVQPQQP